MKQIEERCEGGPRSLKVAEEPSPVKKGTKRKWLKADNDASIEARNGATCMAFGPSTRLATEV